MQMPYRLGPFPGGFMSQTALRGLMGLLCRRRGLKFEIYDRYMLFIIMPPPHTAEALSDVFV